jgi:hypothetical protein
LRDKGLYQEFRTLASEIGETEADATERKERFQAFGWELEYRYSIGNNCPRFDAFKNRVGVEYERREQMNVRSHLLMMQTAYRKDLIDVGAFIIPSGRDVSISRTENELCDELFTYYFPIYSPVFLVKHK